MSPPSASFGTIALFGRHTDAKVADSLLALAAHLHESGCRVIVEAGADLPFHDSVARLAEAGFAAAANLIIAVGGDGTMLRAARLVNGTGVPLLGVNRGRLGFLADIGPTEMCERLDEVLAGQYERGTRPLLQARLLRSGKDELSALALNDVVLQKWETGRMLDFETWIGGQYVNTHGGDGVIVATATGSTAYALSCGGPILHPDLEALVLAPICPHTLSDRPIVVPGSRGVEIRLVRRPGAKAQITCDGFMLGDLEVDDRLVIEPSKERVTLLYPAGHDYYRILRSKLHWGRGGLNGHIMDDTDTDE